MVSRSSRTIRQMTRQIDEALVPFQRVPSPPPRGWVRAIREALGMTRVQFARRLGIARPNTYRVEADEVSGSISMRRLRRAAEALDCRLVYALVPNDSLESVVRRQAVRQAARRLGRVNVSQALEASAVVNRSLERQIEDLATELTVERPRTLWDD